VLKPAPLLLDITRLVWRQWAGRRPTGIDRVCLAYLTHFADRAQAVVQHRHVRRILNPGVSRQLFHLLEERPKNLRSRLVRTLAGQLLTAGDRGRGRPYLNIGHTGLDDPMMRRWIQTADVLPVYLVHDLIPLSHPEFCRAGELGRHKQRMRTVLKTASGVIGNSQATLDALEQFGLAERLPRPPQLAAWLGIPSFDKPLRPTLPDRPTFVVLGTIEARKNHLLLLTIWSRLIARFGAGTPRLLIIGQRGWEAEQVNVILDRDETLRGHVTELSGCSDSELAGHLSTARALLFPSLAEGYGLPLIEALGLGVPVIASDLPVLREIGQNIPMFLSPVDERSWETTILDFADASSSARAAQLDRISTFRAPSWTDHFAAVEHWLLTLGLDRKPVEDRLD
jgi:glycosyltransferase involved in cell wall biosynthesis